MRKLSISMISVLFFFAVGQIMASGQEEATSDKKVETVEIDLWSLLKGDKAELLDKQVDAYNEGQSDVYVNIIHQGGYNETKEKIIAATIARNLPPIIMVDYMEVPFYAQNGVIAPLNDFLSKDELSDFLPGLLQDLTVNGELYGLPYNRSTQGMYLNKDLLAKAGFEDGPKSWEEFKSQALKVKELGEDYFYGYSNFHQWFFDAICNSWGNSISTPEGKITFNNADIVEMMEYFQQMEKDGLLLNPPTTTGGFEEQKGAFVEGKVATILESTSWLNSMSNVVEFDWEFAYIPSGKGGHSITIGGGNFAITTQTGDAEKEAAAKFLLYITDKVQSAEFHMNTGYMPTRYSVLEMSEVKAFHAENPDFLVSVDQTQYAKPSSTSTRNVKSIWWRMTQGLQRIQLNGEDAQTVLDELASEFQTEIDEMKESGTFVY